MESMPRKRPALFEVRYSEKPNRDNHWRIVGFVNGIRTQYWFKSERDAKAAAADKNAEITAYGTLRPRLLPKLPRRSGLQSGRKENLWVTVGSRSCPKDEGRFARGSCFGVDYLSHFIERIGGLRTLTKR
jgi:hypothetical protein